MDFSLFYPAGKERNAAKLSDESVNDLSLDYIADALTDVKYEREQLRNFMTYITGDAEVIRYRCGVFDDFLRLPKLRKDMEQLVVRLKDLMDLERFQKDKEGSDLWSLINRLREIGTYVVCINTIRETLETLDIRSDGMKKLLHIVTEISRESGFDLLMEDIEETLQKAARLKSITIGVNLDDLLRPKNAAIVSLNDTPFTNSGLVRRFMDFTKNKGELNSEAPFPAVQSSGQCTAIRTPIRSCSTPRASPAAIRFPARSKSRSPTSCAAPWARSSPPSSAMSISAATP